MTPFVSIILGNLIIIFILLTCLWALSLALRDAGIVDIFWGLGFVLVAWLTFLKVDGFSARRLIIAMMVTLWGIRLSLHIFFRNFGKPEDHRYEKIRKGLGKQFKWKSLVAIFWLQAVLLWVISLVVSLGEYAKIPDHITWFDISGIFIWSTGFIIEAVSDRQLDKFKSAPENKKKVMDRGLWRYSRHPNYFGESLVWWGIFMVTLSTPYGIWGVISPLTITYLLLRVSGVKLLEQDIKYRRPEYESYILKTSAFIPWFPRKLPLKKNNI